MRYADMLMKKKQERVIRLLNERFFQLISIECLQIQEDVLDSKANLDQMEEEIYDDGLLSPISVIGPYQDGSYKIVDGGRRVNIFRKFFSGQIPCYVVSDGNVSEKDAKLLAISANKVHRPNDHLLNIKYAEILLEESVDGLIEERHLPAVHSDLTGVSQRQARKYIRIVENGSESLMSALKDGEIGICEADTIINTWGSDIKEQDYCVEVCKNTPQGYKKDILNEIKHKHICSSQQKSLSQIKTTRLITDTEHSLQSFMNGNIENSDDIQRILELCQAICQKYA